MDRLCLKESLKQLQPERPPWKEQTLEVLERRLGRHEGRDPLVHTQVGALRTGVRA